MQNLSPGRNGRSALRALLLMAFLVFLMPAGAARAEFEFTPPQTLAAGQVGSPQVAVDPQGRATVAWEAAGPENRKLVQAMRVGADGVPGPVQTLAEFSENPPPCACPRVAVDPAGRATVVWQSKGTKYRIKAARIDAAGNVGPVHTLSPEGYSAWDHEVALDPQGRATIVWALSPPQNVEAVRLGVDGTPEEVRVLAKEDVGASPPALAVDLEGKATVAWSNTEGIQTVQLDPSGAPGPIRPVASTENADGVVDAVVDSEGRATISWWRGGGAFEAKSVRLDADGVPGAVQSLSPPEQNTLDPRLAVDPQGRVTAVWEDFESRIYAVRLDEEGAPETVHPLSEEGRRTGEPQVAAAPDGRVAVVWSHPAPISFSPEEGCIGEAEFEAAADVVKIAFLGPDGTPKQVQNVSPFGEQSLASQITLDSQGRPTVLWESYDGTYFCGMPSQRIQISRGFTPVDPPPKGPGPPPLSPPLSSPGPEGNGVLRLGGGGTAKDGRLRLPVRCTGGAGRACAGKLKLEVGAASISRRLKEALGNPPWLRSRMTIARGGFQLAAGARRVLVLPLTGFGKRLASKGSGQSLRVVGGGPGVRGSVVWVRLRELAGQGRG
jgi:hypothetical protein